MLSANSFASNLAHEALCSHLASGAHARCHARAHPIHRHLAWHHARHHSWHHPCTLRTLSVVCVSVQTNCLSAVNRRQKRQRISNTP